MYDYLFRIIIAGDSNCGKTSICTRKINDTFENIETTVGAEYFCIYTKHDDKKIKLQTWDLAGNTTYRNIVISYMRKIDLAVVVFSIDHLASYVSVRAWIDKILEHCHESMPIILVGTKSDLENRRMVTQTHVLQLCGEYENNIVKYMEVSAKNNKNIDQLFDRCAEEVYKYKKARDILSEPILTCINIKTESDHEKCC
jgi:small GTP-binding protein